MLKFLLGGVGWFFAFGYGVESERNKCSPEEMLLIEAISVVCLVLAVFIPI